MNGDEYRRARGCSGAQHVIPVPLGMTAEEAWAEIVTMGRLVEPSEECTWATVECEGGPDCSCLSIDVAPGYRHFHNDELIFVADDEDPAR